MSERWSQRKRGKRKYFMLDMWKNRPGGPVQGTYCPAPCNKMRYGSRSEAKKAARQMRSDGNHEVRTMHLYTCDLDDQFFHITSWPAARVGEIREMKARRNG